MVLRKGSCQLSRFCTVSPEVNNNDGGEIILYTDFWGYFCDNVRSFLRRILIAGLFSVVLNMATAPRQSTWLIWPFLCNSLHCPFCRSITSECFLLANFTITGFVLLVAFLPSNSEWQSSISSRFTSIPKFLQIMITGCSIVWSGTSYEIPVISTLLHLLYFSDFVIFQNL